MFKLTELEQTALSNYNRIVDFIAAIISGCWLTFVSIVVFGSFGICHPTLVIIAILLMSGFSVILFGLTGFLLCLWKSRFAEQFGWMMISLSASVHLAISASLLLIFVDGWLVWSFRVVFYELFPLMIILFLYSIILTLPVMAVVHFTGLAIKFAYNKIVLTDNPVKAL